MLLLNLGCIILKFNENPELQMRKYSLSVGKG
jgi:hypothetical protein